MIIDSYKSWVIDTRSLEGHGLIGRYWWFGNKAPEIPIQLHGHKIVLFRTRQEARDNLEYVRPSYPKATVIPVTIEVII